MSAAKSSAMKGLKNIGEQKNDLEKNCSYLENISLFLH